MPKAQERRREGAGSVQPGGILCVNARGRGVLGTLVVLSESHAARAAKKERERDGIPARAGLTGPRTSVQPLPRGRTGAGLRHAPGGCPSPPARAVS